jgi:hypothetical protein
LASPPSPPFISGEVLVDDQLPPPKVAPLT